MHTISSITARPAATRQLFPLILALCLLATEAAFAQNFEFSQTAASAFQKADWIFQTAQTTHYKHNKLPAAQQLQVDADRLAMEADCSGFVSYVLNSVAPRQYELIQQMQPQRPYPQSKTFAKFFNSLSSSVPSDGWIRISKYSDLRRGDIIAWESKIAPGKRGNTGHVMIVTDRPGATQLLDDRRFVSISVLDCSSVKHFPPETLPPHTHQTRRDGLGKGYVRLLLDHNDKPIGYWEGTYSSEKDREITQPSLSDNIGFGRLVDSP